jgi:hypothetical protein
MKFGPTGRPTHHHPVSPTLMGSNENDWPSTKTSKTVYKLIAWANPKKVMAVNRNSRTSMNCIGLLEACIQSPIMKGIKGMMYLPFKL